MLGVRLHCGKGATQTESGTINNVISLAHSSVPNEAKSGPPAGRLAGRAVDCWGVG